MSDLTGLNFNSPFYRKEAEIYEIFSNAEDSPGKILEVLKPLVQNKTVLDLGCGNGKYSEALSPFAEQIIGIDRAGEQINKAKNRCAKLANVNFHHASGEKIPLPDQSVDVIIACWVLGTIVDENIRAEVVKEMRRVIKKNGEIYLVENDQGGEFEQIRGRTNDPLERTKKYNDWLIKKASFKEFQKFETCFSFETTEHAKQVIGSIWGEKTSLTIKTNLIQHRIVIFQFLM